MLRRNCPFTGTTIINKIPWGDCPADSDSDSSSQHSSATEPEAGDTQEEDQAEESDTNREEDREEEIIIEEPTVATVQERILNFENMLSK